MTISEISGGRLSKVKSFISDIDFHYVLNVGFESASIARYIISDRTVVRHCLVDIDQTVAAQARLDGLEGIALNVDVAGLPFETESFDLVYAGEILEHLYFPDNFLKEVNRVLKKSGKFVLTTPNIASWYNRILLLIGLEPVNLETSNELVLGRKFRFLGEYQQPVGHIRIFNKDALKKLLCITGFKLERISGYHRGDIPLDRLFSKFLSLSSGFVCLSSKKT